MTKNAMLRDALWRQGWRQADLAHELGVDPAVISRIINGRVTPPDELKSQIAHILELPVERLFPRRGNRAVGLVPVGRR